MMQIKNKHTFLLRKTNNKIKNNNSLIKVMMYYIQQLYTIYNNK